MSRRFHPGSPIPAAITMLGLVLAIAQAPAGATTVGAFAVAAPGHHLVHPDGECPGPLPGPHFPPIPRGCPY